MGKVLSFAIRGGLILESRKKADTDYPMLRAAEHERIAQHAARTGEAMDRRSCIPSDTEASEQ